MGYNITIIKTETKEEKTVRAEMDYTSEALQFNFEDGNMSCDCNRRILFEGKYIEGSECGEGAFLIKAITNEEGVLIYSETVGGEGGGCNKCKQNGTI